MSRLLLIDLIDCLAGAGNEFCTSTKRPTTPFRVTHRFSLHLSPVSRTFTLYRDRTAHAIPSHGYHASTRNKRRLARQVRCIITHVHADRPYASYPHFQPGTRRITVVLRNITRLRNQDTQSRVHFRVIEADHLQIILTSLTLARLCLLSLF